MHYDQLAKPRLLPELLPQIREGDTFDFCGVRFKVTQVIGEACYVGAIGSGWDRHVPKPQLQAVLARIGTPAR